MRQKTLLPGTLLVFLTLNLKVHHTYLVKLFPLQGCRMGHTDKVSLWYVALLINTRFRFFILE